MGRENRAYGMMAGIAAGFAIWGSVQMTPGWEPAGAAASVHAEAEKAAEAGEAEKIPDTLGLHALSAVLMDGDSGRILYNKDGGTFRPMASTTKIMTCILALENGSPDDICVVSEYAASQPKVHLGAGRGTRFYLGDLLYSLMLESHNDTAVVIAEQVAGSVEQFAALMNQKARGLGCTDTWFVTPNGLDAVWRAPDGSEHSHGTTAADLAAVMRYCVMESPKREEFLEITRTSNYTFTDVEGRHSFSCVNHNALLTMMDGVMSGKTGFTGGAGYSYVAALRDGERTYVLSLLGCGWPPHKTYKWADARKLFDYGKENFHYRDVYEEPELPPVPVLEGVTGEPVRPVTGDGKEGNELRLLLRDDETVEQSLELPEALEAPVGEGDVIGRSVYRLDGEIIKSFPLYADHSVMRRTFEYEIRQTFRHFFLIDL